MKTLTLTQRRKDLAKAWKNYVIIRRAYCEGKTTLQELAHALALVSIADTKADMAQTDIEA